MMKKFKNIISILLLLVFLLPYVIKFDHHHESFVCKEKNEKHFHDSEEICIVCNFEFSVFYSELTDLSFQPSVFADKYLNNYISDYYAIFPKFTFLLRAPPLDLF